MLMLAGVGRRVWAQALSLRFRPLARPVMVPLDDLVTPWRARQFVADGVTLPSAATPNQPIRFTGMVVRTAAGDNQPETFTAVCVRCPHEGCDVEFVPDPASLPQDVKNEIGRPVAHAVYLCQCHNSTFKSEDGTRLSGPAPRGLYRFRVTSVKDAAVEIAEVEEDLLLFV
ncbi:MAG: Rieske 2Fe-2S domain-containing protein [Acidobacteriota bacterium]|nr:Rieske 2Fe-2S domain-containing protein [Acidobacteriota bacterium]